MGTPAVSYSDIPQGAKIVSAPQYSDVPQGAKVVSSPSNVGQPQFGGNFTGQLNPKTGQYEDTQVNNPPSEGTVTRFAKAFNQSVTGSETPQDLMQNLKASFQEEMAKGFAAPDGTEIIKGVHQGMQDLWNRATDEWKQGNYSTARGLITKADAAIHAVQSGLPILGPLLAQAGDQFSQGNAAGGAGTLVGAALPLAAPAPGAGVGEVAEAVPAAQTASLASRIPAPVIERGATGIGAGIGGAIGHATGIPGGGEVGAVGGAALGRSIGKRIVGAQEAPQATAAVVPTLTPGEPVPASLYFKALKEGNSPQTARMLASETYSGATKAAGNITSAEARQAFLDRPVTNVAQAQKVVSDVVDQVAPETPLTKKMEIDFKLQKGDVDGAQKLLEQALEDKYDNIDMRAQFANEEAAMNRYKSRLFRAGNSADANKGSLMTAQQVVDSMPAPGGTMEANKLLGYEGRRTIPEATAVRTKAVQGKPYLDAVKDFVRLYYGNNDELKVRPQP